jgi:DNA-binding NarL/FixJ family response regulator
MTSESQVPSEPLPPSHSPRSTWRELFTGRYRIVRWYDRGGRRYVVVHPRTEGGAEALTSRQRRVLAARASGMALKLMAFEWGLSIGTISRDLSAAMARLGLESDLDVAAIFVGSAVESLDQLDEDPLAPPSGLARADARTAGEDSVLSFPKPGTDDLRARLTPAERAIVDAVLAGLSTREIAGRRGLAERTVANHIAHVFEKLQVRSRLSLALVLHGAA